MPQNSANSITAIPVTACPFKNFTDINFFFNQLRNIFIFKPFIFILPEKQFVFFINEVTYLFKNCNRICVTFWMLPQFHKQIKQLISIGQVEISCKDETSWTPVILSHHGVRIFYAVAAKSSISQMSKINFSGKREILFCPHRIVETLRIINRCVVKLFIDFSENVFNWIGINRTMAENVLLTRRNIDFYSYYTGTILSAIVLLFHQQIKLVHAILPGSIF